ncbi:MAG: glycogen/starch synthase [Phycisphaerae bacterium]|nr:glycogen/starch synthase [Phycisphaerae bacterium]
MRGPCLGSQLTHNQIRFFYGALNQTARRLREYSFHGYRALLGKTMVFRLIESFSGLLQVTPREVLLDMDLLRFTPKQKESRRDFLVALLERAFYQQAHPDAHISQVMHHSLHFLAQQDKLCAATIHELGLRDATAGSSEWLAVLLRRHKLVILERFWKWVGEKLIICTLQHKAVEFYPRAGRKIKDMVTRWIPAFAQSEGLSAEELTWLRKFRALFPDGQSMVLVYALGRHVTKVIRICGSDVLDAMASPAACFSVPYGQVRTDIFYDHHRFIAPWLETLTRYQKDASLAVLAENLISSDLHVVDSAVDTLSERIRNKNNAEESLRLLYASLYYWHHPDRGVCRSIGLRVSQILEDLLTERPASFPPSRVNRCVIRGDQPEVKIKIAKPYRVKESHVRARLLWAVNGHRKRPVAMEWIKAESSGAQLVFRGEFSLHRGWVHYSVQVSHDQGRTWQSEVYDEASNGLLKWVADERGHRILSFYADTFNLRLDQQQQPLRDEEGSYVTGTFATIAEQLQGIRDEGYTRIYPLGALELGWPGEAGPDPSVFSVWDGRTVRRDMGGIEGLLALKEKADTLGMKVILCALSHFSRAQCDYPYHYPVYIAGQDQHLSRRAGWDGEWDEWFDSFMVNMRDFDNVSRLATMAEELAGLGFGLRIDVGHGYDTVFPVHPGLDAQARLLGEVTVPGFDPVDLRGTAQPNIPLLYLHYRAQKRNPSIPLMFAEQWHGNEARMLQSGAIPYNSLIKNLENIRAGESVHHPLGMDDNLHYLRRVIQDYGGQTMSLFNTHDEESPTSNYQNMIWPAAAFLVFSSYGPIMYHISRLPGIEEGSFRRRFDQAYLECWKHWVNNRFNHPWPGESGAKQGLLEQYPLLKGFGLYLRSLYSFADEHPALTRGSLIPVETHNGRIAAFIRHYGEQFFLCVMNFPNPHHEGQGAVAREFNVSLKSARQGEPLPEIKWDDIYEIKEKYNNAEGRRRRGKRGYWSGEELIHLGFGGVLEPVSSHVYEIIYRDHSIHEKYVLPDSFLRYFLYGKQDRVRHAYIASAFRRACQLKRGGFKRFVELFVIIATWILKSRTLGMADLSMVLAEISEDDPQLREVIIEYLMRVAVMRRQQMEMGVRQGAADILHAINVGTIVMVSPESKFSGSSGGVGLYTTDIADVLSEMGFHVVIVTPLYECNRAQIFKRYAPRYEGHSTSVTFPRFDEGRRAIHFDARPDVVNFLRAKLNRMSHGKRSRVEVIYLENSVYFNEPYGGSTAEDKLRRARLFAQSALEALRCYNYYPAIIQTNEWPTWLIPAYLQYQSTFREDPHFANTETLSMMHNPHPAYSIVLAEQDVLKWSYYCRVLDLNPASHYGLFFDPYSSTGHDIDLTHIMLKTSSYIGTVSRAMRQRILDEPWLFRHVMLFREKAESGRFFGRRNGFNMAARQRFWFGSKKSLLETYSHAAARRLFLKYTQSKRSAKLNLQNDPCIRLTPDHPKHDHIIFGMLHRISRQKGFELLVDWKVYAHDQGLTIQYEPWNMRGSTVLEYFLSTNDLAQFVICGRVEDSFDGRRFDAQFHRIAGLPDYQGRFAYYPEGSLSPALYRNLYIGSQFFVMPSGGDVGEPCGISQQEAHAGGTPVIAHHQDGLKVTVSDGDFGDIKDPINGIKFQGFNGGALLGALQDAVEIYTFGHRRLYQDAEGNPVKLTHAEMSFNAFNTDHRWLRLLHDYVKMYAQIHGQHLPEQLDAIQLIVEMDMTSDRAPADAILKKGMSVPEAIEKLIYALACELSSVRGGAAKALIHLEAMKNMRHRSDIHDKLKQAEKSSHTLLRETAKACLAKMARSPS